jgi:hypothetical protein
VLVDRRRSRCGHGAIGADFCESHLEHCAHGQTVLKDAGLSSGRMGVGAGSAW